jgi:hypothetical protein
MVSGKKSPSAGMVSVAAIAAYLVWGVLNRLVG